MKVRRLQELKRTMKKQVEKEEILPALFSKSLQSFAVNFPSPWAFGGVQLLKEFQKLLQCLYIGSINQSVKNTVMKNT